MKTNNKNSAGNSKPIPNNLDSGTSIQNTIWKLARRWRNQLIVSGAIVLLAILTSLDHILDFPHLLVGEPPSLVNWGQIAFDLGIIFLVGFVSIFMLSVIGSKHKRMEEALRESEERYRTLYENAPIGIYRTTPDGRILMANPTLIRMLRFSSFDELASRNLEEEGFEATYPRSQFKERIEREGEVIGLEAAWVRRDNLVIFVRENAKAVRGKDGDVLYYEGTVEDITERKRAEETLREQKEVMQTILENIPVMIAFLDSRGNHKWVNQAWQKKLGWSLKEAQSRDVLKEFYPDPEYHQYVVDFISKTKSNWGDFRTRRRDGTVLDTTWTNVPLSDGSNIGIGLDITERKKTEEALKESEEKYRELAESITDVFFATDKDLRYTYWNKASENLTGISAKDAIGKSIFEVFPHNKETKRSAVVYQEVLKTQLPQTFINEYHLRDKKYFFEISAYPSKDGLSVFVKDITERKRAEEALKESEEKFRTIFESVPISMIMIDEDGIMVEVSPHQVHHIARGLTPREGYIGKSLITHPTIVSAGLSDTYRGLLKGKPFDLKDVCFPSIQRGTGGYYFNIKGVPLFKEGEVIGAITVHDEITERKRAEEALRDSKERFSKAFHASSNLMGISTVKEGRIIDINEEYCRLTGYKREELIGQTTAEFNIWADPGQRKVVVRKLQEEGRIHDLEVGIRSKSGDIRTVLFSADTITLNDEPCLINMAIDITERKRAEEKLKEAYDIINRSPAVAFLWKNDEGWPVEFVSDNVKRLFGYTAEEFTSGKVPYAKVVYPDDLDRVAKEVARYSEEKGRKRFTHQPYRIVTKDGKVKWIDDRTFIRRDEKGRITYYQGIVEDITERKRTEAALQSERDRLQALMEGLGRTGIGIDVVGIDYKVLFQNQTLRERFGDLTGKLCYENYMGLKKPCDFCPMLKAIKSKMVESVELKAADGRNYELISAPFPNPDGTVDKVVEVVRDITHRKKMEAQLIQAERLSAVGTLSYGIAHEFNNILAGILCNAEFGMGNDDPKEVEECFRIIMEGCDRAKSITNGLLAFSRHREARRQIADITEAVNTVLGLIDRELEKQNVKVVRKFRPVPEIACDLGELSGIFLNMITNARDAMGPNGGTLTIEIGKRKDNIVMIFSDTGCGIPDSIKSRIFEPFVTTKGALGQSEIPGTGLGLFLSYGIIIRYHGEIKVKSEVDKGSRFTIKIPISKNQVTPALVEPEEEKQAVVPQNLNILLVDDEKPICDAIKKFLENKGHNVTTTLSGKKGFKIFKKGGFDLVLADITIPDMDGVELISKLKEIDQQVKFIVLTGHIAENKLESAKKAGADHILMKPFRNEELYQVVGKVLSI